MAQKIPFKKQNVPQETVSPVKPVVIGAGAAAITTAAFFTPFKSQRSDVTEPIEEIEDVATLEVEAPDDPVEDVDFNSETLESSVSYTQDSDVLPIATCVKDNMSFNQAFAAARREVGPGGMFYYNGKAYGTYYANEWESMTEDDRADYWNAVSRTHANYIEHHQDPIHYPENTSYEYTVEDAIDHERAEIDLYTADVNHNGQLDILVDFDDDSVAELALMDVVVDDNGQAIIQDVQPGHYVIGHQEANDNDNEWYEADSDENNIDDSDSASTESHEDYDLSANTSLDPNIPIDNHIDTSDMM